MVGPLEAFGKGVVSAAGSVAFAVVVTTQFEKCYMVPNRKSRSGVKEPQAGRSSRLISPVGHRSGCRCLQ